MERTREGKKLESSHFKKHKGKIRCVKADGKRSKTAIGNGKYKVKDHVTVIVEPSGRMFLFVVLKVLIYIIRIFLGEYLGKFTPESGTGKVCAAETFFLLTYFQSISIIIAAGCDGTGNAIF